MTEQAQAVIGRLFVNCPHQAAARPLLLKLDIGGDKARIICS
jgi:hypothetical protein